jgi:hypothetical protein
MAPIERELEALKAMWAEDEAELQRRQEAARAQKLEQRRESLLSGDWKPMHRCDVCLRAILSMEPSQVCDEARHGELWWQ